jgi:hypothetical protein
MKNYLKTPFLILLFILFTKISFIKANEEAKNQFILKNGDLTIKNITINGLQKTNKKFFNFISNEYKDTQLSSFNSSQVKSSILKYRNYRDVNIDYIKNGNGVDIIIKLTEKSSFVPIPFVAGSSGGGFAGGFVLLESNLFGYNKFLMLGGRFGKKDNENIYNYGVFTAYKDSNLFNTNFSAGIFINYSLESEQFTDVYKALYFDYDLKKLGIGPSVGYSFNNNLSVDLKYRFLRIDITKDNITKVKPSADKNLYHIFKPSINFNTLTYNEIFAHGFNSNIYSSNAFYSVNNSSKYQYFIDFNASYGVGLFTIDQALLSFNGSMFKKDLFLQERAGKEGSITLPNTTTLENNFAVSFSYEISILPVSFGTFSLKPFIEYGILNNNYKKDFNYSGAGIGTYLYLAKINIPAIGLTFYKNFTLNNYGTRFFIGASF